MDERYLNFNKFVQQRAAEISKFTEVLQLDTNKRTHQALPKSVRRRAMSHNRFRIPLKMRRPMEKDLINFEKMQKLPKCRKSIRKKHRLILSYKLRSEKIKWLSTHLWAAKRMKMKNYCGFKISETPNDKSFRSAYRNFRHNSVLFDFSYLHCISIQLFEEKSLKEISFIKTQTKTIQSDRLFEAEIYEQKENGKLVCPLFGLRENSCKYRLFFDPFALESVKKIEWNKITVVKEYKIAKVPSELYLLMGPESVNHICEALKKMVNGSNPQIEELEKHCLGVYRNGIDIIGDVSVCKTEKPFISEPIRETIVSGYDPESNRKARELFFQSLQKVCPKVLSYERMEEESVSEENKIENFFNFYENLSKEIEQNSEKCTEYIQKVTTRSYYTHKRKNKLTKQEKKEIIQQQQKEKEKEEMNVNKEKEISENVEKSVQEFIVKEHRMEKETEVLDPLMICTFYNPNSNQNLFKGCFVFCSSKNNTKLWRALSYTSTKVIGLRELRHCYFESRVRIYPNDFPESVEFETYNKKRAMQLIDTYRKHPPQKRPSYTKNLSPFPFHFWVPGNVGAVWVEMIGKGRCHEGSYICAIEKEDLETLGEKLGEGSVLVESQNINKEKISPENQEKKQSNQEERELYLQSYEQIVKKLTELNEKVSRKIIGFVTTGGFSFSLNREAGMGYIFEPQKHPYILIRKNTSKYYYVAEMKNL